ILMFVFVVFYKKHFFKNQLKG
ncbi:hypothetical protein LKX21_05845, partial [Campylobacter jejuni]|nr:hypothetical protein [Campylobacter jejuni]